MSVEIEVQKLAEQLHIGGTRRGICPTCQGGDKHEVSFVVGREADRVWYKCFRAKCPTSGIIGAANLPPALEGERARALDRLRPYGRPINVLTDDDLYYFLVRFEISPLSSVIGVTDTDEYVIPVRGPIGQLRGHVVRQPVWKGSPRPPREGRRTYWDEETQKWEPMPKTVLYPCSTQPMLAWYKAKPSLIQHELRGELVLVEDQVSAIKVAEAGVDCAALLGNGLNVELVRDILKQRPKRVTIALDPGAEGQAQNLAKKWGLYFDRTRVVMLEADPKDILARDLLEELHL